MTPLGQHEFKTIYCNVVPYYVGQHLLKGHFFVLSHDKAVQSRLRCIFSAYRNFCGALDWFSLSVGGVGVSRGGVEFVPVDAGPVCGRDAVVRFGRRCLFALPQGVGDE